MFAISKKCWTRVSSAFEFAAARWSSLHTATLQLNPSQISNTKQKNTFRLVRNSDGVESHWKLWFSSIMLCGERRELRSITWNIVTSVTNSSQLWLTITNLWHCGALSLEIWHLSAVLWCQTCHFKSQMFVALCYTPSVVIHFCSLSSRLRALLIPQPRLTDVYSHRSMNHKIVHRAKKKFESEGRLKLVISKKRHGEALVYVFFSFRDRLSLFCSPCFFITFQASREHLPLFSAFIVRLRRRPPPQVN